METKWTRMSQKTGCYQFSGKLFITPSVFIKLPSQEIHAIVNDIKNLVASEGCISGLQVYENEKGVRLFFIDQLNEEQKKKRPKKENYATLCFSWEI